LEQSRRLHVSDGGTVPARLEFLLNVQLLSHFEFVLPSRIGRIRVALFIGSTSFGTSPFTSSDISSFTQPLPVPTMTGLTRSQSLFSTLTGINVHALSIETSDEFFLLDIS
jgi:hypothetical protein